jgi:putative transposase
MDSESFDLKNFSHNLGQNWYHVVLISKYRYPIFRQEHQRALALDALDWICKRHKIDLYTKEVMDDHVHLFVSCPPEYSIRKMIQLIKGGSSYFIRRNHPSLKRYEHLWSRGSMYRFS